MGENPSIYTHNRSRESYSIPRKYLSIGVCHGCVAHDRHAPMSHIRHGIGNRHILTDISPTPLLLAVQQGHHEEVKLLLGREDVNSNTKDYYGETPLWRAAWKGRAGIVKLLLEREDANPNI